MATDDICDMRQCFDNKIIDLQVSKRSEKTMFLSDEDYVRELNRVKYVKVKPMKGPEDLRRLTRYDIIKVNDEEKLIKPGTDDSGHVQYYATTDQLFDIIHDTHVSVGHCGRNRMSVELRKNYCNISKEVIMIYLSLCKKCQEKNPHKRKRIQTPSSLTPFLSSRGQIDIIDMSDRSCNGYNHILVYQDQETKFLILKPLCESSSQEIALNLLEVFTTIGAPTVLQSEKGQGFIAEIISDFTGMWDEVKVIFGKHKTQLDIKSIKEALAAWLSKNEECTWDIALKFVQFKKNRTYSQSLRGIPYEAMFKCKPRIGLAAAPFNASVLKEITSEEDIAFEENCLICSESLSDRDRQCDTCDSKVHMTCGRVIQDAKGFITSITCNHCLDAADPIELLAKKSKLGEEQEES